MNQYPTIQPELSVDNPTSSENHIEGHNHTSMRMPTQNVMRHVTRTMVHGPRMLSPTELPEITASSGTPDIDSSGFDTPFIAGEELSASSVENMVVDDINNADDSMPENGFSLPPVDSGSV